MNAITQLARPEIQELRPYREAQFEAGLVRLNANETPWRPPGVDSRADLNNYPEARPQTLARALADNYGVAPEQLLVTRGSSEAIDLLMRCFCRPGQDGIIICPPTFGMYEVYAQVQGATTTHVPLRAEDGFTLDTAAILAAWTEHTKLVFVCSPNNPTGNRIPTETILELANSLSERGIVVVDAAYTEFADTDPTQELLRSADNIVVLRTLSKALGLAGIRCGAALGAPPVIELIGCILPPYSYPTPCQEAALACLSAENQAELRQRAETLRSERDRLARRLATLRQVEEVWPSEANFVLARVTDPTAFVATARAAGFLLRNFSWDTATPGCVRITIGTPADNERLLEALARQG